MMDGLGQFRADLVHERLDVLGHRRFSFPLVELFEAAFLALREYAGERIPPRLADRPLAALLIRSR